MVPYNTVYYCKYDQWSMRVIRNFNYLVSKSDSELIVSFSEDGLSKYIPNSGLILMETVSTLLMPKSWQPGV